MDEREDFRCWHFSDLSQFVMPTKSDVRQSL